MRAFEAYNETDPMVESDFHIDQAKKSPKSKNTKKKKDVRDVRGNLKTWYTDSAIFKVDFVYFFFVLLLSDSGGTRLILLYPCWITSFPFVYVVCSIWICDFQVLGPR